MNNNETDKNLHTDDEKELLTETNGEDIEMTETDETTDDEITEAEEITADKNTSKPSGCWRPRTQPISTVTTAATAKLMQSSARTISSLGSIGWTSNSVRRSYTSLMDQAAPLTATNSAT